MNADWLTTRWDNNTVEVGDNVLTVADWASQQDPMVWVSDQLGLCIDSPLVERVDLALFEMNGNKVGS